MRLFYSLLSFMLQDVILMLGQHLPGQEEHVAILGLLLVWFGFYSASFITTPRLFAPKCDRCVERPSVGKNEVSRFQPSSSQ